MALARLGKGSVRAQSINDAVRIPACPKYKHDSASTCSSDLIWYTGKNELQTAELSE